MLNCTKKKKNDDVNDVADNVEIKNRRRKNGPIAADIYIYRERERERVGLDGV